MLFFACKKDYIPLNDQPIQDQTFDTDVRIQGHQFDGLIFDGCTFDGGELYISDVDSVIIRNCTFQNQKGRNGVRVGFGGLATHIIIENCTFQNIGYNGISSFEDAHDCVIRNCYFENCALSDVGAAMGQPHHAIYWMGRDVQILNNEFYNGNQNYGNGISVRSSGKISGNKIYDYNKYGIMYYSDHPGGDSLFIENNFVVNCANGIAVSSSGTLENHNENVHVRFNTVYNSETYSVFVANEYESTTDVQIYGNIVVHASENYLECTWDVNNFSNLTSTSDVGFVDVANGDLHLNANSTAIDFCSGLTYFPTIDIDGDLRFSLTLDAGADERN